MTVRRVYLDHNATTPLRPEARAALLDALDRLGGNPSAVHAAGRASRASVDDARQRVAAALGVHEDEIVFTSGGTESNNLALAGALRAAGPGAALVTTAIEHPSVLEPARALEALGHPLRLVGVDARGDVDVEALIDAAQDAAVVSVAAANGEIGSLGPLDALVECGARERCVLHVDAAQALGRIPLALGERGIDLATLSGHKVGGPAGVGVLVRRRGTPLVPLALGGGQESELRAGTENAAGIVATACAVELAVAEQKDFADRTRILTSLLWRELRSALPDVCVLGPSPDREDRLPNTLNVSLPARDGRVLVARLDLDGVEVSSGSACASGSLEPSHVLLAMGLDRERARGGLRLSSGYTTTREEIHIAVERMSKAIARPCGG